MKISISIQERLMCPASKVKLRRNGNILENVENPTITYPIIDGIPVLISDTDSIFSVNDFVKKVETTFIFNDNINIFKKIIRYITPQISINLNAKRNYKKISAILPIESKILVIGGSIKGSGMESIYSNSSFEVVGLDVSFGPYTKIISDAHDLPFIDDTFDCVIIQAVLEHVLDPHRCVSELHRVLKSEGLVYSETPFMQQVHMKQYDFTRFTHLGHRRLFRNFVEIESGVVAGPGTALAWSYTYFLRSFGWSEISIKLITKIAYFTAFFLKYFDYFLMSRLGSYDAASGFFFIGKKSVNILSDRDLIGQFKGNG
jgi:SAM-dependent methyltransferase